MVQNTVAQFQCISIIGNHCPSTPWSAGLLVSHANSAVEGRIRIAVRGIEQVENFFGKVEPAFFIEVTGVVLSDFSLKVALPWRDILMYGFGCGRKEIGIINTLLMHIRVHMWQPLVINIQSLAGFGLRCPGPVAVQVVVIVIGSSAWPGFTMLAGLLTRIGALVARHPVPVCISVVTVGVYGRINNNYRIFKVFPDFFILSGSQIVCKQHTRLRTRCFIAVNTHADPHDGRLIRRRISLGHSGQSKIVQSNLFQSGHILRTGNNGNLQGSVLVSQSVIHQLHRCGSGICQIPEVIVQHVVRRELVAYPVRKKLVGRFYLLSVCHCDTQKQEMDQSESE